MADAEIAPETEHARVQKRQVAGVQGGAWQSIALAGLSLGLAFAAQRSLDRQQGATVGVLLYALAAVFFVLVMRETPLETQPDESEARDVPAPSVRLLIASLGVALLGCLDFGGNEFRPMGLMLWIGGLLVALHHLSRVSPEANVRRGLRGWRKEHGAWIPVRWLILLAIVLLGAWLRLYRLHEIPADLGPDLNYHYYNTVAILDGQYRVNFPERGSLLFYCTALCARLIGMTPFTLFFTSALIGIVTIVALYALGAATFGPQVALLAALLLAINRWHLLLSRSAYPAVQIPLVVILVLYTLVRALRRRQFIDFAWCGLHVGLCLYTWTPAKVVPAFVVIALSLFGLARGWKKLRPLVPRVLLLCAVAVVVAAPMLLYAIEKPHEYFVREEVALRLRRELADQDAGLAVYFSRTLLGLNYWGDQTARWNYPRARHMGFVSGMWMVLGLAYALWRWRHGYNVLLVSAWFVLLLPGVLGMLPNEGPNGPRMSGMLGPAVLLAAVPLPLLERAVRQAWASRHVSVQAASLPADSHEPKPCSFSLTIE